jgi:hypothetical protein
VAEQKKSNQQGISPRRLRAGVVLITLWFLPFWVLAAPIAAHSSSADTAHLTAVLTAVIMIIQTVIGIIGLYVAGSEVKELVKTSSKKQALGQIWYILIHGKLNNKEKSA